MSNDRFLLIKAWSYILWADVEHVLSQLLIAELTDRIPIVYWPTHCLHNGFEHTNGFELYFEPVSNYTIFDIVKPQYTYYPPVWDQDNLLIDDPDRETWVYRNIGEMMTRKENVVVGDVYFDIYNLLPFIKKGHPAYGMTAQQVYRYLFKKYIRIKQDINVEIQGFYNSWLKDDKPVLAVHVCGPDKNKVINVKTQKNEPYISKSYRNSKKDATKQEIKVSRFGFKTKVLEANQPYHAEIKKYIDKYDVKRLFLLTNSEEVLKEYKKRYGSMLVATECKRISGDRGISFLENPMVKRRQGIEIIKDTYLAAKCDFFIGNDFSSLSHAVVNMKDWPDSNVKLLYWKIGKMKHPINVNVIGKREKNRWFKRIVERLKKFMKRFHR